MLIIVYNKFFSTYLRIIDYLKYLDNYYKQYFTVTKI